MHKSINLNKSIKHAWYFSLILLQLVYFCLPWIDWFLFCSFHNCFLYSTLRKYPSSTAVEESPNTLRVYWVFKAPLLTWEKLTWHELPLLPFSHLASFGEWLDGSHFWRKAISDHTWWLLEAMWQNEAPFWWDWSCTSGPKSKVPC